TQRGVEATVHALTLGADDYVPKPGDGLDVGSCIEELLIPKIKLLGLRNRDRATGEDSSPSDHRQGLSPCLPVSLSPCLLPKQVEVVVVGASTGGPNALAELLPAFPPDWAVPLVIVQHMPPAFTARLAERLAEKSRLRVREAEAGELISAAQAWVAPGGHHLLLSREGRKVRLDLNQEPPVNS